LVIIAIASSGSTGGVLETGRLTGGLRLGCAGLGAGDAVAAASATRIVNDMSLLPLQAEIL
jgi:hypothetical protein